MYCRFPKEYFFEVEKSEDLIEFEEIEDMREIEMSRGEVLNASDIFEFDVDEEDEERNKCKCYEKKEKHMEHKDECGHKEDKCKSKKCGCTEEKCSSKEKCKKEGAFFSTADLEYIEEVEIKIQDCKCNCKK